MVRDHAEIALTTPNPTDATHPSISVPEAYINNGKTLRLLILTVAHPFPADTGKCEPCMNPLAATCGDDGGDATW